MRGYKSLKPYEAELLVLLEEYPKVTGCEFGRIAKQRGILPFSEDWCQEIGITFMKIYRGKASSGAIVPKGEKYTDFRKLVSADKEYQESGDLNKAVPSFDWRSAVSNLKGNQEFYATSKEGQDRVVIPLSTNGGKYVSILAFGDAHFGSWCTDYERLLWITDVILNTEGLYVVLLGDMIQMSIVLRSVAEMQDNLLSVPLQYQFLESWMDTIKHKVLFSTWDNHAVMRAEKTSGYSVYGHIMNKYTTYFPHIGDATVRVNDIDYHMIAAHYYRGKSHTNPLHSHIRFIKENAPWADIVLAGDSHEAGVMMKEEGGKTRAAVNSGSLQNSSYGRRHFALKNQPYFPVLCLSGSKKLIHVFYSLEHYLEFMS